MLAAFRLRWLVVLASAVLGLTAAPASAGGAPSPATMSARGSSATTPAAMSGTSDTLPEPNVFLPEDRNLSDCLSSLPKPNCGSEDKGGPAQLATFGVLMLGMAFIGWRVFRSVKRRDEAQTPR